MNKQENTIVDHSLQFYINICIRCDDILGSTKVRFTGDSPFIQWFHGIKPKTPLMCNKCLCFMCDDCRDSMEDVCMDNCSGKFVHYHMVSQNDQ